LNLFSITPVGILIGRAEELVKETYPELLNVISYNIESHIPQSAYDLGGQTVDGAYDEETKTIYLHTNSLLETALHEIGHAVHYQIFNAVDLGLPVKDTVKEYNQKEVFAEAFKDSILNEIKSERDKKIIELIKAI
jgi:hypothetical protein